MKIIIIYDTSDPLQIRNFIKMNLPRVLSGEQTAPIFLCNVQQISDIDLNSFDLSIYFSFETLFITYPYIDLLPVIMILNADDYQSQVPYLKNVKKIIALDKYPLFKIWSGIPEEIILHAPLFAFEDSRVQFRMEDNKLNICWFPPKEDQILSSTKTLIYIFNHIPNCKLHIFTSPRNKFLLEAFCNKNIFFLDEIEHSDINLCFNLVIGSTNIARLALSQCRPTFILGTNGLGGMVTPDDLDHFERTGFKGRIGGVPNEEVPLKLLEALLIDAIKELDFSNTPHQILARQEMKNKLFRSNSDSLKKIAQELQQTHQLLTDIKTNNLENYLIIKNRNIRITSRENGEQLLSNQDTGKILGTLGEEEGLLFDSFIKGKLFKDILLEFTDFEVEDLVDFVKDLIERKIVSCYMT